ncbi:MAG: enoyl-CoA hydratase/isomerase family protein [Burkholderiaceae bacterium]
MPLTTLELSDDRQVRTIWLNRPDKRNAMNDTMIAELNETIEAAIADDAVRIIVLAGRGKVFCAGGDLAWMKTARTMSAEEAQEDSARLARVMQLLYESPKPTIACVHGSAFAGAMGLVSAVDIALASEETRFCLSEVKLGLIPAMISPYVIKAVGERHARRLMLTAEIFDAPVAQQIGLIHECVEPGALESTLQTMLKHLLAAGPQSLGACKSLIQAVSGKPIEASLVAETAARIAKTRASDEAQEGIAAFFEKRAASWVKQSD